MMTTRVQHLGVTALAVIIACCLSTGPAWSHNQLDIGRNAAGQLKIRTHIHQPFPMPESIFAGVPGYAVASVGLASAGNDSPANDFFMLAPQADIDLVLVGADPGMYLYNIGGTAPLLPGETWHCGLQLFHLHPLWQINPGVPGQPYAIQFYAHDLSGTHSDSPPFTMIFAPKCNGDTNVNGTVDIDDLLQVITEWGPCNNCDCDGDLSGDCVTDMDDLLLVINNWGMCR